MSRLIPKPLFFALVVVMVVSGCDAIESTHTSRSATMLHAGVLHQAGPNTQLSLDEHDRLVVSGPGGAEVRIQTHGHQRADIHFKALGDQGGVFESALLDDQDQALARIRSTGLDPNHQQVQVDFSGMQATSVTAEFYLHGTLTGRLPNVPLDENHKTPLALSDRQITSFHFTITDDYIEVYFDYENASAGGEETPEMITEQPGIGTGYAEMRPLHADASVKASHVKLIPHLPTPARHLVSGVALSVENQEGLVFTHQQYQ
ncbi:MAG: hypothetical protein AAGI71_08480 [Bacteroidota bacterium]